MRVKFLTLNIWWGGIFADNIIVFIKKENPDICTMQEVIENELIQKIKNETHLKYSDFSPMYIVINEGKEQMIGNMVLSKFPLKPKGKAYLNRESQDLERHTQDSIEKDPRIVPRMIQRSEVTAQDLVLNIFNVHGVWGYDGWDNPERLKMSEIIINETKDKENVILAGDFNMERKTKSIEAVEKYVNSVFKDELKTSFNMKHKPTDSGYAKAVVDMIFVSPNIKVLEHYCPDDDISDHKPLVAILEI